MDEGVVHKYHHLFVLKIRPCPNKQQSLIDKVLEQSCINATLYKLRAKYLGLADGCYHRYRVLLSLLFYLPDRCIPGNLTESPKVSLELLLVP